MPVPRSAPRAPGRRNLLRARELRPGTADRSGIGGRPDHATLSVAHLRSGPRGGEPRAIRSRTRHFRSRTYDSSPNDRANAACAIASVTRRFRYRTYDRGRRCGEQRRTACSIRRRVEARCVCVGVHRDRLRIRAIDHPTGPQPPIATLRRLAAAGSAHPARKH